ncbi:2-amino-3-carboxymuconate-6-semialdehyde decarboxylase-like protein [Dinothrombium tinctorium]|uniref:2-amino-3-carboxymuconate-6-semialdehyde decarboxylase n=1 Tax=Dinothrombium tinctorium TaxID=1965070 RepID=A0A3S3NKY9_9ACAR|nr:2-amino-3-carboxymuconate-6-semialdehyde decarboxylase-like protein [Dinothrombium tinctorium]
MQQKTGYSGWISLKKQSEEKALMIKDNGEIFRSVDKRLWSAETRLKIMKDTDVTMQVLSTVPIMFNYWAKGEDSAFLCRYLNNHISSVVDHSPKNFIGLGAVPLQSVDLAIEELKRCKNDLKLSGVMIGTCVNDYNLDSKHFDPFYKTAQELDCPIFVHPVATLEQTGRMAKFMLPYLVGMPTDTTIAICSMIFGGVFEKFPNLKVCFAHGGGMFPYTIGRIDRGFHTYPTNFERNISPTKYVRKIYVDTLVHSIDSLLLASKVFGEDRLLLGSDYPFLLGEDKPGHLIECSTFLTKEQRERFLFRNATNFFNLKLD